MAWSSMSCMIDRRFTDVSLTFGHVLSPPSAAHAAAELRDERVGPAGARPTAGGGAGGIGRLIADDDLRVFADVRAANLGDFSVGGGDADGDGFGEVAVLHPEQTAANGWVLPAVAGWTRRRKRCRARCGFFAAAL